MNTVAARRAEALQAFERVGVPHRRVEDWKYTDIRADLGDKPLDAGAATWELRGLSADTQLFDLKLLDVGAPEWVTSNFGRIARNRNAMDAASFALSRAGFALRIPGDAQIDLRWSGEGSARGLIVLERGAALTLSETVEAAGVQNIGVEFALADGATLTHIRRDEVSFAVAVEEISASLARDASYRGHFANFGARLSRVDLALRLEGESAAARLSGVSVLDGERHADVTTRIDHIAGKTESTQLFKLIAGGRGRAVYQGKIVVHEGAMQSDSRQTAKGLLLGERAEIDLKPELEILADDVKCAHGAAVGDLDAESLFYLRSRGIPEAEARALLMRAFFEDAVAAIADETIRAQIWEKVEAALNGLKP